MLSSFTSTLHVRFALTWLSPSNQPTNVYPAFVSAFNVIFPPTTELSSVMLTLPALSLFTFTVKSRFAKTAVSVITSLGILKVYANDASWLTFCTPLNQPTNTYPSFALAVKVASEPTTYFPSSSLTEPASFMFFSTAILYHFAVKVFATLPILNVYVSAPSSLTLFSPSNQPTNVYPALVDAVKVTSSPITYAPSSPVKSPASSIFLTTSVLYHFAV